MLHNTFKHIACTMALFKHFTIPFKHALTCNFDLLHRIVLKLHSTILQHGIKLFGNEL